MIKYIKASDGTTSVTGAEKIEVVYLEAQNTNPYVAHRATPIDAEARRKGGAIYRFRVPLAIDEAIRKDDTVTSNVVDYDGLLSVNEVELVVSMPFMTKTYPMDTADVTQMDGINFSQMITDQIGEALVVAEIREDHEVVTSTAGNVIDGSAEVEAMDKLKFIKKTSTNYFKVSADNEFWTAAGADKYFLGNKSFKRNELRIHASPNLITELSDAQTDAGNGSDLQFRQTESGEVPVINGIAVIENPYLEDDQVLIMPLEMIGTPDVAVMTTDVVVARDELNTLDVARGKHFYNSVLVAPELVTLINFAAAAGEEE